MNNLNIVFLLVTILFSGKCLSQDSLSLIKTKEYLDVQIKYFPNNLDYREERASALMELKRYADAENDINFLIKSADKFNAEHYYSKAYCEYQLYRDDSSMHNLAIILGKDTFNFKACYLRGLIFMNKQLYDSSEFYFGRCLNLKPNDVATLTAMGRIYMKKNEMENAKNLFNKALSLDESCDRCLVHLAYMDLINENLEEAQKKLKMALKLNAKNPYYWFYSSLYYNKIGDKKNACYYYSEAKKLGIDDKDDKLYYCK